MAARERWAGSSCSHALKDYQDPPLKGRFLGTGVGKWKESLQSPGPEGPGATVWI